MTDSSTLTIGVDASRAGAHQATGTERYSRRIIEAVVKASERHQFRLYRRDREPLDLSLGGSVREVSIPFPRLWTHARLSFELWRHPVDALFVPAHVVPLFHPRATVTTVHDLGYLHEPDSHTGWSRLQLDLTTRWSARAAHHIIAISAVTKEDLIRRYGIPAEKISVIYHGIDDQFRPLALDDARLRLAHLGPPERYLLFVGTLQPRKNLPRLIQAFDRIADDWPDLHLVLTGKRGWLYETIEAAFEGSRARDRIQVMGHVPDELLPALYTAATGAVLPSLYEGFGLPALEAMACGIPVLISDRGALPEIAGGAAVVVLAEQVDSIEHGLRSLLDPGRRERLIDAGLAQAARFRWSDAGRATLAVIERAARSRR